MTDASAEPLSQLLFDDSFFSALKDTDVTLRRGRLNVAAGPFNFVAKKSGAVMPVEVTAVECRPFREVAEEVFSRDGKGGKEQTLRDMQKFYPDMTPDSPV